MIAFLLIVVVVGIANAAERVEKNYFGMMMESDESETILPNGQVIVQPPFKQASQEWEESLKRRGAPYPPQANIRTAGQNCTNIGDFCQIGTLCNDNFICVGPANNGGSCSGTGSNYLCKTGSYCLCDYNFVNEKCVCTAELANGQVCMADRQCAGKSFCNLNFPYAYNSYGICTPYLSIGANQNTSIPEGCQGGMGFYTNPNTNIRTCVPMAEYPCTNRAECANLFDFPLRDGFFWGCTNNKCVYKGPTCTNELYNLASAYHPSVYKNVYGANPVNLNSIRYAQCKLDECMYGGQFACEEVPNNFNSYYLGWNTDPNTPETSYANLGENCGGSGTDKRCKLNHRCVNGKCAVSLANEGEPCGVDGCQYGLYCDTISNNVFSGKCVKSPTTGQPCLYWRNLTADVYKSIPCGRLNRYCPNNEPGCWSSGQVNEPILTCDYSGKEVTVDNIVTRNGVCTALYSKPLGSMVSSRNFCAFPTVGVQTPETATTGLYKCESLNKQQCTSFVDCKIGSYSSPAAGFDYTDFDYTNIRGDYADYVERDYTYDVPSGNYSQIVGRFYDMFTYSDIMNTLFKCDVGGTNNCSYIGSKTCAAEGAITSYNDGYKRCEFTDCIMTDKVAPGFGDICNLDFTWVKAEPSEKPDDSAGFSTTPATFAVFVVVVIVSLFTIV